MANNYDSESIKVLEGLDAVRKVPGMYIGSTGKYGLHHLVYEIIDNSVDESLAGHCDKIKMIIHNDNSVTIEDNGRGIPVKIHKDHNKSALEIVLTVLHAGGKFDKDNYKVSGGLHGVGISVVNALASHFEVWVKRDGNIWHMTFENGGKVKKPIEKLGETNETGTKIRFKADESIFSETSYDYSVLRDRIKELAFLMPGLNLEIIDERTDMHEEFHFEDGLKEYILALNENKQKISPVLSFTGRDDEINMEFDVAFQYVNNYSYDIYSFVNNIKTIEGGTHVIGFRTALSKVIADKVKELSKKEIKVVTEDVLEGVVAIVSIKHPTPEFEGQTKSKLGNSEVRSSLYYNYSEKLKEFLDANPDVSKAIAEKVESAMKAREAAQRAKQLSRRKDVFGSMALPGKLADCSSEDSTKTEIFIVEGDSAGGSAKQARERDFQAILPLRGKILNVEKARIHKILANEEINAMITAFGTNISTEFTLEKLRYNKIVIMTDADVDGAHISCLLMTFFYRYMKQLIEEGHVYLAMPPLFLVKQGSTKEYVYSEEDKEKMLRAYEAEGKKVEVQRYKGLGEMNPEQLWDTTMNPETRKIKQVTIDDAIKADQLFTVLMGEEVEPRKAFIIKHSHEVTNLDV